MDSPQPDIIQLGAFEPNEAKRLLPLLESDGIPFEVEADHSALLAPGRTAALYLGTYPEGSKLAVFVREEDLPAALDRVKSLFPL